SRTEWGSGALNTPHSHSSRPDVAPGPECRRPALAPAGTGTAILRAAFANFVSRFARFMSQIAGFVSPTKSRLVVVDFLDLQGVLLDEVAARLYLLAHQRAYISSALTASSSCTFIRVQGMALLPCPFS